MHYKAGLIEIEDTSCWRLRLGVIGSLVGGSLNEEVSRSRKIRQSLDKETWGKETRSQCENSKAVLVAEESRTTENMAKRNKDKDMIQTGERSWLFLDG